ncbi:molybdopterin adenylyltransferase [Natronohydrobacter thiooxidans]|uniref:molybdopterin adenylyltransferase n=1 Tax=Natronohydrobacter thiooxidans TaxID=87172 RepID=UPI0008FF1733|nr:molybdopterin adenylyltransferase [Natronohydrobacter thiooxidans]
MPRESASIAIVTVSDRAARGVYEDRGGPAAEDWIRRSVTSPIRVSRQIVPDERDLVAGRLRRLAEDGADLVLITGGTGPAPRDRTPEALADVIDFDLPGFGEEMRRASLREVPTAILSRQGAGVRGQTLFITLPGKPAAIATCLDAVFASVPYCLDLIGAARIETDPAHCPAFRPRR